MPTIVAQVVPTGGAISLAIVASGTMMLARAVSGVAGLGSFTTLYSGIWVPIFIDAGDGLPAPLASGTQYVYRVTDTVSSAQTTALTPNLILNAQTEPLLGLMMRLIQGAILALALPAGIQRATVLQAMPLTGVPAMPIVTINLDLIQQEEVPIGVDFEQPGDDDSWVQTEFVRYVFRVSVLSTNSPERDFYRDIIIATWRSIAKSVLAPIGLDNTHRFQAAAGQVVNDPQGNNPGFYFSDIMLVAEGTSNIAITPTFGPISIIDFTASTSLTSGAVHISVSG